MAKRPERPVIPLSPPMRVKYEPRSEWLLGTSRVELRQLEDHQRATVVHHTTGAFETVPLSELKPIRTAAVQDAPAVVDRPTEEWIRAALEETVVRQYVEASQTPAARVVALNSLGISERTLRDKVKKWTNNPTPAGMMNRPNGRPVGSKGRDGYTHHKLREAIIREVKMCPDISARRLHEEFMHGGMLDCKVPSLATIGRLLLEVRRDPRNFSGQVGKELKYALKPIEGALTAESPLQKVEMDGTLVDVHIRHPHLDVPIGRPWLTVAIDWYTRVILGIYLSLDPPGALSTAICLRNAVLPKNDWLEGIGASGCVFPGYGLMREIYTDNGPEFKNGALDSAFQAYNIKHSFRPPGDPAKGGIIERAIGTLMKEVRLLPGASYSDRLKGTPKDIHKRATKTLQEVEKYLAHVISKYHQTIHEGVFMRPLVRWQQAWHINGIHAAPELPLDQNNFLIALLPFKSVSVIRGTVTISRIKFGHSALNQLHGKHQVRFDPRDSTRVYVKVAGGFVEAQKLDPSIPSMSFYEWQEWRRQNRDADPVNPEQLAKDLEVMRSARQARAKRGELRSARAHARQLAHEDIRPQTTSAQIPFARPLGRIPRGHVDGDPPMFNPSKK